MPVNAGHPGPHCRPKWSCPCNICGPDPDRYANIMRMNRAGSGLEVYARERRNAAGFDLDPRNGELWFADNDRGMRTVRCWCPTTPRERSTGSATAARPDECADQ